MTGTIWRCCLAAAAITCAMGRAEAGFIDFEVGAPSDFASTSPLTELYAPLGVHFSGPAPGQGGAILDQDGNFGIDARSGTDFLAFNRFSYATDPETIRFDALQGTVSIYASSGESDADFALSAFDAGGALLGTSTVSAAAGTYGLLSFTAAGDVIRSVTLTARTGPNDPAFVYDDLSFTSFGPAAVPEPSSLALTAIAGLSGLGYAVRRRRKAA